MNLLHLTPKMEAKLPTALKSLLKPAKQLNEIIEVGAFGLMVDQGDVRFPMGSYDEVRKQWLTGGALSDFVAKMREEYQHFDAAAYEEDEEEALAFDEDEETGVDPQDYVSREWRKVTLGGSGRIQVDLPLCGPVKDRKVWRWTRAEFLLAPVLVPGEYTWDVRFDPTGDCCGFDDPQGSLDYVKMMQTGGQEVDLRAPNEK